MTYFLTWLVGIVVALIAAYGYHFYRYDEAPVDEDTNITFVVGSVLWPVTLIGYLVYKSVQELRKFVNRLPGSAARRKAEKARSSETSKPL